MEVDAKQKEDGAFAHDSSSGETLDGAPSHQQLDRNFSLLSISAVGIVTGNTWAALGGSPPGVLYEFVAVSVFYWIIAASIAELASAIPSSGGVYHWASITPGPRWGRMVGFFAGWWNYFAWIFGAASVSAIVGNCTVAMYSVYHPDFIPRAWHVFVSYLIVTWSCCCIVLFANKALPAINNLGLFFILGGVFITIVVCATMPSRTGNGYATNDFVWRDWSADIGYTSDGFIFLLGMLNGAYSVGTPDCISHLSEEIPRPEINVPKGIAAQMGAGFVTAILYMIAIFYAISDLDPVVSGASNFPLAVIYSQATGSNAGTVGLLLVILLPLICTIIGCYITAGRTLWTLARDDATPSSRHLGRISATWRNPFNATLVCGSVCTVLGCIYVGSSTAFNAFVGSFVVFSTLSYIAAIGPHLLSKRSNVVPGPFWMKGMLGFIVNTLACCYIIVFVVIYCFPYALPVTAANMNYSCLITGGLTIFIAAWWLWKGGRGYKGPRANVMGGSGIVDLPRPDVSENV
ncbi:hypothetical protein MMC17_006060 [Xylographa soralifera]|nr:hypothetical protein [Xylographa soralifera]